MGDSTDVHHNVREDVGCDCNSADMEPVINAGEPVSDTPPIPGSPHPESLVEQKEFRSDREDLQPSMVKVDVPSCYLTNMDCPVCFSRYDIYRVPKELSCKHNFCAICLKLLIRHEEDNWVISCPICRASTAVFGGLVCTLQNQESLMRKLENPDTKAGDPGGASDTPENAVRLSSGAHCVSEDESHGNLQMAAKRLVVLLLMLLIILIIILQFVYTGVMKWVLVCLLGVVVILTVLLCFNPNCNIRLPGVKRRTTS
ncbi:E3 ubiquitin-protein ligase RNF186 [Mixophyes fleayi]|uniref:E3 ubiquitin-protein ligase RNF186 n=1 Tax=Mixophyes fleayi TaxID=3061075 RepID=UPI003F4D9B40